MGLDQLGVLAVGTLVPKEGGHTLLHSTLLVIPPGLESHRSWLALQGHNTRAYPMQHMVDKAHTRLVAANLISGHLVHAGNHRHGTAGHNQGRSRAPKPADVEVSGSPNPIEGGS